MSTVMASYIIKVFRCNKWKIVFLMLLCASALLALSVPLFASFSTIGSLLFIFVCGIMAVVGLFRKQFVKTVSWIASCVIALAILWFVCARMPTATECVAKCIATNMEVNPSRLQELWHCHGPDAVFVFRIDGEWGVSGRFQEETFVKGKKKIVANFSFYATKCVPEIALDIDKPIYWCSQDGYVIYVVGVEDGYAIFYIGI